MLFEDCLVEVQYSDFDVVPVACLPLIIFVKNKFSSHIYVKFYFEEC